MTGLKQADYDQAVRYVRQALKVLDGQSFVGKGGVLSALKNTIRRLSGDSHPNGAASEITALIEVASNVPIADAKTEIHKAVAVLRVRTH